VDLWPVVHGQHWWSLTGQTLSDGPNVLQKGLNRVGSLTMVGFESEGALRESRGPEMPEIENREGVFIGSISRHLFASCHWWLRSNIILIG
jgi:hypothetical protein